MTIQNNFSLKKYNTFGIEAKAKQFVAVNSIEDLNTILKEHQSEPKFILGGGSNMLLTQDIQALVIHIDLKGKKVLYQAHNLNDGQRKQQNQRDQSGE